MLCNSQASSTGNNASWPILTALLGRVRFPHVSGARIGPPSLSGLRWRRNSTYSHRGSSLPCPLAVNDMFWLRWRALEEYQCGVALAPLSVSAVFRLWGRASVRLLFVFASLKPKEEARPKQLAPTGACALYLFTKTNVFFERAIFFCNCNKPYNKASAVGGHPGTYTSQGTILSHPLTTL